MRRFLFLSIILAAALTLSLFAAHVLAAPVTLSLYEAEDGTNTGRAGIIHDTNTSGGSYVAYLAHGSSNAVSSVNGDTGGDYILTIRYAAAINNRTMSLYINDVHFSDLTFPSTGGYTAFSDFKTTVTLNYGINNTIKLQVDPADTGDINIDYYKLDPAVPNITPGKYEAENGAYLGGAHNQSDPNASGGYIAAYFGNGTSVTITVDGGAGGDYLLSMIYAAAINNRTMSLYVNDAHISDLRFPGTGGYTTYSVLNTNITLNPAINRIRLQVDNGAGDTGDVNFDYFTLQGNIDIPEVTLERIEITRPAAKLSYLVGESLDITGIAVTGIYSDGSIQIEPITAANVTGFDSSAPAGSQVLTVTYGGRTAAYTVTIASPTTVSNDAALADVLGKPIIIEGGQGTLQDPLLVTIDVDYTAANISAADISAHNSNAAVTFCGIDSTYTEEGASIVLIAGGTTDVYIRVTAEDTVTILYYKAAINKTPAPDRYEAENGAYSGGAHNQSDPNASGGYIAAYFGNSTSVTITVDGGAGGDYLLSMRYAAAINNRTMSLYINDAHISDLSFPGTGGYTTYSALSTNITLNPGINRIRPQVDSGAGDTGDVNFDYLTLAPRKTTEETIETQICPVKDNKQAIWTFTTDDGIYNSVVQYNNLFKMYGLKGTVGLNPYTIQDTDNGLNWSTKDGLNFYCGTWSLWQTLIADGHLDIADHSATHPHLTQIPQTELNSEINGARAILTSHFSGQSILGFIDPYGDSNNSVTSVVQQQHFAERSTIYGENSLSPDSNSWFHLHTYYATSDVSADTMNNWIDSIIANKSWCIETWHGILSDEDTGETLWSPSTYDICNDHLSYVANNTDKIWNATYSEAIQYIRERQNATLSVLSSDSTHIQLSLADDLDNSLFNYPLTLRVQVPNNWISVSVKENGSSQKMTPVTELGKNYIYFDAVPDQGNIDITETALEQIIITKPASRIIYSVGESLDITGIEVTGIYSDGSTSPAPIETPAETPIETPTETPIETPSG